MFTAPIGHLDFAQRDAILALFSWGVPPLYGADPDPAAGGTTVVEPPAAVEGDAGKDGAVVDDDKKTLAERLEGVTDPKDRRIIELSDENAQKRIRANAVEEENKQLKLAADKAARKEASDLANANKDLTTATEKLSKYEKTLRSNLLRTAILEMDDFTWHDISDVLFALKEEEVSVDLETGKIEGLPSELRRVAKDKPHFVKATKSEKKVKDVKDGNNNGEVVPGASGQNPGGTGSTSNQIAARRAELEEQYPALRNRR